MRSLPKVSIVVPFHNEEENIPLLYSEIQRVMAEITDDYELVFVDDKSSDGTVGAILAQARRDPRVVCIKLRRNHGQTGALAAGFDHARGEIIISMDGDLQHDPADIPALLAPVVADECDIASGWRKARIDPWLSRKLPSKIANWIMAKFSGLPIHDFGTTFKAYRREILSQVRLYGDLHRFIPALALAYGARVREVPINSRVRQHGKSHYNITRTFRVMFDLITIRFLLKYLTRPLHFFGRPGLACFFGGTGVGVFLVAKKLITRGCLHTACPAADFHGATGTGGSATALHGPAGGDVDSSLLRIQPAHYLRGGASDPAWGLVPDCAFRLRLDPYKWENPYESISPGVFCRFFRSLHHSADRSLWLQPC